MDIDDSPVLFPAPDKEPAASDYFVYHQWYKDYIIESNFIECAAYGECIYQAAVAAE